MVKKWLFLAVVLPAACMFAQDAGPGPQIPSNTAPPLLQRPYEAVRDFFNFYALANAIFDSNGYYNSIGGSSGSSAGIMVGGGATGFHQFASGSLSLSYKGDYRRYFTNNSATGNDQLLYFDYNKHFRRWGFAIDETAGILFNGGNVYSTAPNVTNPSNIIQSNPFSTDNRYTGTTLSASYQASMRLSYSVAASYFISRYNAGFSIGANDISVLGSAQYRLTRKATIAGTYSHGNYHYQHGAGDSNVDSVFGTLGYTLGNRWSLSVSGGMSRSSGNGTVRIPLNLQIGQQIVTVYATGRYQSTSYVPYYQGTVTRLMRHSSVGVSAGEGVTPGNGLFLTSRNINVNGLFVQEFRRSNISGGAYYNRLSSVSNTVTEQSNTRGLDVSYSYNLIRHVGVNARYDYINFSSFGSYGGRADNRLTFGVYFESKDIPLGLF